MHSYSIYAALILAVWIYIANVGASSGLWWCNELIGGAVAGLVVGDLNLGLKIGATLTFMSLGMWTYGGASIPDFNIGAIIGTVVGALGGGMQAGLVVAVPVALLMSQCDVLAGIIDVGCVRGAEKYIEEEKYGMVSLMHFLGVVPAALIRAVAIFLVVWVGAGPIQSVIAMTPNWFVNGMTAVGNVLPALGFAVLLSMMDVKKYWMFLLVGYVLYGYFKTPIVGIAIMAVAIAFIYKKLEGRTSNECSAN